MKRSETFKEFAAAYAKFQSEIENPKMTADNPYFKSKYAPLDEVLKVVRPILSKYGLSVYQDVSTHSERHDHVVIITTIFHESGEYLESSPLVLPAYQKLKDGRMEFNSQGAGSSITYAKRYQLQACLGIAADSDLDGEEQNGRADKPKKDYSAPNSKPLAPDKEVITKPQLAVRWQLLKGTRDGFDAYYDEMREKGRNHAYIADAIEKSIVIKSKQQQQQQEGA